MEYKKKYFCKYLPVEGEIKEGDYMRIHVTGEVVLCDGFDGPKPTYYQDTHVTRPEDATKVKLFLCSRDNPDNPIGSISSGAKWVRENDEFSEDEIQIRKICHDTSCPPYDSYCFHCGSSRSCDNDEGNEVLIKCSCCDTFL